MKNPLFSAVEAKYKRESDLSFDIGDTVVVTIRIVEGDKERLQDFIGEVIARRGQGLNEMFTVRRLVGEEGVERTFPVHSPKVASIKTRRSGKVRRCKLYYLRDRVGKARRLKERRISAEAKKAAAAARAEKARRVAEAAEVEQRARSRQREMAAT
ncbi:MAG: 50S ribosomal protein L19 [Phycisphaerae bacterium]|nr:50S ribosomal protein L19 [Phycisphaerae bacterium]MCZ2399110.1 50S ribosomal protein L19 [Phycisphaerae bacterium]NUQ48929.1 50S ribosomal protein L19 [Phycisphaerae bacterium]